MTTPIVKEVKNKQFMLMNKNVEVLKFDTHEFGINNTEIINKPLLPEILKINNGRGLETWLRTRSVDLTRSNARILTKRLGIGMFEPFIVIANRALSLTDTFWIRFEEGETFEEYSLYNKDHDKIISTLALSGVLNNISEIINTELTNIGSLEKAWIKNNNEWWLYKSCDPKGNYAELFTYYLNNKLNLPTAIYSYDGENICTLNFTDENTGLEHYSSFRYRFDDTELEDKIIASNLEQSNLLNPYLDILLMDGVVCNPDRHEFNFGVLRNTSTNEILKLAPNFDNNLAFGGPSKPSTFMLKEYLKDFGIQGNQKEWIKEITPNLIKAIDNKVKAKLQTPTLDTSYILDYLDKVLSLLK